MRAKTIKELKEHINKLPDDLRVRVYEGEVSGIVVETESKEQVYFIDLSECEMVCSKCENKHSILIE